MPSTMDENGNVVDLSNNNVANTNNGKINAQGIASALGGAASAFGTAYSTYADVQNPKDWVQRANAFQAGPNYGGSSFDSWTQAFLNNRPLAHIGLSDVGYNTGKGVMNALGAGVQGAGAGASIGGGWGALAGGIIGTLGGLFGMGAAKRKAQRTVNRANEAIDYTNAFNTASLNNSLNNIRNNQFNNLLRNYSAFGGPLNMSGDGVLSPFGSRFSIGGPMHSYGADWTNGIKIIEEGGTHEENPYEGVQMGIDPQGVPNLVEEGEVIWNDYVFSNRMKVPKKDRIKYKLTGPKNLTYAEAAKKAQKESEERPNDPISKRGLEEAMARLANSQEEQRQEEFMREIEKQAKELGMTPEELLYAMQQQQQQPMVAAYGGNIHIKPSKKGTFTAAAKKHGKSVQEFASQVLANKDNYSSAMVKKANFARNAAGWKHGLGGNLFYGGGRPLFMSVGVDDNDIYRGSTIELPEITVLANSNPVKQENDLAQSNKKESNSVAYSNVQTPDIDTINPFSTNNTLVRNQLQQKNINDWVTRNTLRGNWKYGLGGNLFAIGGLPYMIDWPIDYTGDNVIAWALHGNPDHKHYLNIDDGPKSILRNTDSYYLPEDDINTQAERNKTLDELEVVAPVVKKRDTYKAPIPWTPIPDNIKRRTYIDGMSLPGNPIGDNSIIDVRSNNNLPAGATDSYYMSQDDINKQEEKINAVTRNNTLGSGVVNGPDYDWFTGLRYAPILSSAISGIRNLLTPADYSRANDVERAYSNINDVKVTPKYNYMQYRPIDRMIMANMIGQQAAATRRNIMNTSGGNRGTAVAGLLASDNQYLNKLGEAFIAGDAENYKRYAQTLDTNNKINQWLGQLDLGVQEANQRAAEARARGVQLSRGMMDAIDAQRAAAISNDWTNVAQGLGDIGWEQFNRNMVNSSNPIYGIGEDGNVYFKGGERAESLMKRHLSADDYKAWKNAKVNSEEYAQLLSRAFVNMQRGKTFSRGGYLTIKGRKK